MSKISLAPNAAGTAIFTIESPGTSTNRTLTLPDDTGTIVTNSGNQAGSFTTLNTSGQVVFNDAGADVDFRVEGDTEANLLFVDASADKVGIGTSSPSGKLHVAGGASNANFYLSNDSYSSYYYQNTGGSSGVDFPASQAYLWSQGGTERMRIDSSGNVLVGQTTLASNTVGASIQQSGVGIFTRDGAISLLLNRKTSDGDILEFRKDGTSFASIGVTGGRPYFATDNGSTGAGIQLGANTFIPADRTGAANDNTNDIGTALFRWDDVYATNGTIQTSDRNEKQDIEDLSEAETRVAVAAKGLLKKYRWKSAVAEKGDDARIHFGIIAQDLKAAFEAEGLDAGRYAMFIHSEWWETQTEVPAVEAQEAVYETQTDEEGNETQVLVSEAVEGKEAYTRTDTYETEEEAPEGAVRKERMGIRYNELLAFIIAAI